MYFDFDENHPDFGGLAGAISWREGILLSIIFHLLFVVAVLLMPELPGAKEATARVEERLALERQRQREAERFVFVAPRIDTPAPVPPPRAAPSDKDRTARAPERAQKPTNMMPFSRGNTPEKVEAEPVPPPPPPQPSVPPSTQPPGEAGRAGTPEAATSGAGSLIVPNARPPAPGNPGNNGAGTQGLLGSALRDLQRYARAEGFDNQGGGGGVFGPSIQFDTKGVEFGPWIRRFIAQIKRNWFIPYAAMAMKGHVVVTFYVMKDGRIAALAVPGPCEVSAFNNAAYNALAASNPTQALPPEYPSDRAFFTVTFYYNETPPG
jgi:outer membrane biosynthesis protein TonB